MRISIFNLNNNDTYKDEYIKIIKVLNSKCITMQRKTYSYFEYINTYLFNNWKYRNTYIDCYEYLKFIGVNVNSKKISLDGFINLIEFILNIQILIESNKYYNDNTTYSVPAKTIIFHNIPLILDKLNYQAYDLDDKVMIFKKDIDYEDLFNIVPDDINELILSYSNINNNGIKTKRIILNKLYNYLLVDYEKYKSYNSSIFSSIKLVINKMGVIGDIDKKYQNLSNYKLRKYYDYCFNMITYLLRTETINKYKEELKNE